MIPVWAHQQKFWTNSIHPLRDEMICEAWIISQCIDYGYHNNHNKINNNQHGSCWTRLTPFTGRIADEVCQFLGHLQRGAEIYGLIPFLSFLEELDSFCPLDTWFNFKTVKVKLTHIGILFWAVGAALQFFLKRQWVSGSRFCVLCALVLKYLSYLASSHPSPNSWTYEVHSHLGTSAPATNSPFL